MPADRRNMAAEAHVLIAPLPHAHEYVFSSAGIHPSRIRTELFAALPAITPD
ncbi:hypothetical protein ACQPZ8_01625 [Actinomadura nitritigenes]|uniref:hypothetical protein n=1 Tax=Actinomadura nitritigenes TaxID=134602 RepID=UPI003D8B85D6